MSADDQTAADSDQTASDSDQTWSDRDQASADDDQRAADDDVSAGNDPVTHERTASVRARTMHDREAVSKLRDETATTRSVTADERDRSADLRDRAAEEDDRTALLDDRHGDSEISTEELIERADRIRAHAAADRARAAEDRARAAADREQAAHDRAASIQARNEARRDLALAATDELTGALARKFGLGRITVEIDRARRTSGSLILAFLDVDGLKQVNDEHGHLEGDRLLRRVGEMLREHVRPYDVIVRYGGDEFLCAMPNLTRTAAAARMATIVADLSHASPYSTGVTVGLAELEAGDDLNRLVERADSDLLGARRNGHG
jgi:diguanylate cyclase (GGDEF)-like protein